MSCATDMKNLGVGKCSDLPAMLRGIIETPPEFRATAAQIASQSFWQDAIADDENSRIYLWPLFADVPEDISTEAVYEENPVSFSHILDGFYRWRARIKKSLCFHKAAFSHRNSTNRVWLIDAQKKVIGTYVGDNESGDAQYAGFTLDLLSVENLKFGDGSVSTKTPLVIALKDPNEVNDYTYGAFMFSMPFLGVLSPLTDVEIAVTAQTTTDITVTVAVKCDRTKVIGLVAADFEVFEANGTTPQTIDTVTEGEDGTYVIHRNVGSYVDGLVGIVGPKDLSVYPISAYELVAQAAVDIP